MKGIFDQITEKNDSQKIWEPSDEPLKNDGETSPEAVSGNYTPVALKSTVQELLRYGIVEATRKPNRYKTAQQQQKEINDVLEPLDLLMELDEIRGIAFLKVAGQLFDKEEEWSHPLVRRQRFTLEQSLLVAILRQHFIAHEDDAGIGAEGATIHIEDLLPQLQDFLGDPGSDAKEQKRLRNLLEKLKVHGIVSEIDAKDRVTIKPLIAHLANPESLDTLLHHLKKLILEKQTVHPDGEC